MPGPIINHHDASARATPSLATPLLLAVAYIAFISLGLPDAITGVAWPSIKLAFERPTHDLGGILVGLCVGYFTSGILAGRLIKILGIGGLLSLSCLLVCIAMSCNAAAPQYSFLIVGAVVWGLGSGAIDAGLNAYAASHFPHRHMNWLHACYSLGAAAGPLVMSAAIVRIGSWRLGYGIVAGVMFVMMLIFLLTKRGWQAQSRFAYDDDSAVNDSAPKNSSTHRKPTTARDALAHRVVWIQVLMYFCYTGLEAGVGQWGFTWLTRARDLDAAAAGFWVSAYFFAIGLGRILTGVIVARLGIDRLLQLSMVVTMLGFTLMLISDKPWLASVSLVIVGLGLAAIFPGLMSRTPERLGDDLAAHAIGFQIAAATLGAATIPGLTGFMVEPIGPGVIAAVGLVDAIVLWLLHQMLLRHDAARSHGQDSAATMNADR